MTLESYEKLFHHINKLVPRIKYKKYQNKLFSSVTRNDFIYLVFGEIFDKIPLLRFNKSKKNYFTKQNFIAKKNIIPTMNLKEAYL